MTDSTKLREQTDRGLKADAVLDVLGDKFKEMEQECFEAFKKSDMDDDAGRKNLRLHIKAMTDLKDKLEADVISGNNATKQLNREKDAT